MDRVQRLKQKTCAQNLPSKICIANALILQRLINDLEQPVLPRIRKEPPRFRGNIEEPTHHTSPKTKHKELFFGFIQINIEEINIRFNSDSLDIFCQWLRF